MEAVRTGEQALRLAAERDYDLIIADARIDRGHVGAVRATRCVAAAPGHGRPAGAHLHRPARAAPTPCPTVPCSAPGSRSTCATFTRSRRRSSLVPRRARRLPGQHADAAVHPRRRAGRVGRRPVVPAGHQVGRVDEPPRWPGGRRCRVTSVPCPTPSTTSPSPTPSKTFPRIRLPPTPCEHDAPLHAGQHVVVDPEPAAGRDAGSPASRSGSRPGRRAARWPRARCRRRG